VISLVSQNEINQITEWCEKTKKEKNKIYILERNPFKEDIKWTQSKIFIEIDRPMEVANKTSLVYDSTTKQLWHYIGGSWRQVVSDVKED
jgi:hypothetical protein